MSMQIDASLSNVFYPLSATSFTSVAASAAGTTNLSSTESISAYIAANTLVLVAAPATATSAGTAGSVAYDATHIYVCIATNSWVRATTAAW